MQFITGNEPQELKEAAARLNTALKRLRKAQIQSKIWFKELEAAQGAYKAEEPVWSETCGRWNPDSNTMEPKREELPF